MPQAIALAAGQLLFSLGAPLGLVNAVAIGGIGSAIAGTAIAVGASFAGSLLTASLANQQSATSSVNSPEIRGSVRQALPPQRVIYGQVKTGGAVFFLSTDKPPYLYLGLLLSSRPISEVVSITAGEKLVTFDGSGNAMNTPFLNGSNVRLSRSVRLGTPDQTVDPILDADFADVPSTFRQRGTAAIVFKCHYGADYNEFLALWGNVQIPVFLIEVKGAPVYDPRDPTQVMYSDPTDLAEVQAAQATWKYSNTASLVQADFLIADYGGRLAPSKIRWDKIAEAATYDEGLVGLKDGGTQKRWTIDGVILKNQDRQPLLASMLTANRGFVTQANGRVWVTSSKPRDPILTIHDGLLVGGFQFRAAAPKKSLVNQVTPKFVAPDRDYQTIDGPVLVRDDLITADQEQLAQSIDLPFTSDYRRAQRLSKGYLLQSRLGKTWSGAVTMDGLGLAKEEGIEAGAVVRIWSELLPKMNGLYQIQSAAFADDFSLIQLSLSEYDGTIDGQWAAADDEQDFTIIDVDEAA